MLIEIPITILLVYSSGFDVLLGHVQHAAMEAHKKERKNITDLGPKNRENITDLYQK